MKENDGDRILGRSAQLFCAAFAANLICTLLVVISPIGAIPAFSEAPVYPAPWIVILFLCSALAASFYVCALRCFLKTARGAVNAKLVHLSGFMYVAEVAVLIMLGFAFLGQLTWLQLIYLMTYSCFQIPVRILLALGLPKETAQSQRRLLYASCILPAVMVIGTVWLTFAPSLSTAISKQILLALYPHFSLVVGGAGLLNILLLLPDTIIFGIAGVYVLRSGSSNSSKS